MADFWRGYTGEGAPTPLPSPPAGHVRVRIAVAADADGKWSACGQSDMTDEQATDEVTSWLYRVRTSWVTADVPLPTPVAEVIGATEPT